MDLEEVGENNEILFLTNVVIFVSIRVSVPIMDEFVQRFHKNDVCGKTA